MQKKRNAKGEGNFKKNPDGTITHRKSVGYKSNGKRKVLTVTEKTKTACLKAMNIKEAEWKRIKDSENVQSKNTVLELCLKHLNYQAKDDQLQSKSIDRRECTIRNQIEGYAIANMQIHALKTSDIECHIASLIKEGKVGASSIKKAYDVINAALQWAVREGALEKNPAEKIKKGISSKLSNLQNKEVDEGDVIVFSKEDVEIFEKEAMRVHGNGNRYYSAADYLLLLLHTGMRCGELIAMRWEDVDWEDKTLTIDESASMTKNRDKSKGIKNNYIMLVGPTKNKKKRRITMTPEALVVLKRIYKNSPFKNPEDLIAPTETGKMNTTSNLEHRQKLIQKNAGLDDIPGGLHIFRKTFATAMYDQGYTVGDIAAYIGDLESTTEKYYISNWKTVRTSKGHKRRIELKHRGYNLSEQV